MYKTDIDLIKQALNEDLGIPWKDVTTDTLFADLKANYQNFLVLKGDKDVTVCGIQLLRDLYKTLDNNCYIYTEHQDGDVLSPGETLLAIEGPARALLIGERTALNFIRHLSAIATLTAGFVAKVKDTGLKILDTRKTTPCFRHLEKYAVSCGGGVNHRMGLYDAIMVKDTHVDLLGGMQVALQKLPLLEKSGIPAIIEVRNLDELRIVLDLGQDKVSRVLLDNMNYDEMRASVALCTGKVETEASGNINLETITDVAATGVDFASVGMLTHSAGNVDLAIRAGR